MTPSETDVMMHDTPSGDVRFLKGAALVLTAVLLVMGCSMFQHSRQVPHFGEIDVERMNIVEPDGTPRLIMFNSAHTPAAIIHGVEHPHPNRRPYAGMLYFNDEGTENGGGTTFDQFDQDQVVSLGGGLRVWDEPYIPMSEELRRIEAIRAMPEGTARDSAQAAFTAWARANGIFTQRVMLGLTREHAAQIELTDVAGKPRVRLVVDSAGGGRLDFLGDTGEVIRSVH